MAQRVHSNPSNTGHSFATVPRAEIPRSTLDRSHGHKTTIDAGWLYPIYVDEVIPGDTVTVNPTIWCRMNTPIHPVMDNAHISTFFFFVPNRLLWENWQRFNGEQDKPTDSTDYLVPHIVSPAVTGHVWDSIYDHFALPVAVPGIKHQALWNRGYVKIWNDWFRDQNLQDSIDFPMDDGPDDPSLYQLLKRGKRHDYFTSCLPWPQKGPAVPLPLGDSAPVLGIGPLDNATWNNSGLTMNQTDGSQKTASASSRHVAPASSSITLAEDPENVGYPLIFADLQEATGATINALRQSFAVQKLFERDARGGTRYIEVIKSHFGVTSPDMRLQRSEFLGGGRTPVNIAAVAQTVPGTGNIGDLGAVGTALARGNGFTQSFTEHGIIIGLACVWADLTYQQGLQRMWSRETRWDYYWPALSHIGEQAVLNKEIYAQGDDAPGVDDEVFGYQERHAEYRYKPSVITGRMRSIYPQSLDIWHYGQDFANLPTLSPEFIEENPPIARTVGVQDEPLFKVDMWFQERWARPMPAQSVPGLIDHF